MPRDLFGDVTRPSISVGNRKWYTVPLSLVSHSIVVGVVVVVPLMATSVLPPPWRSVELEYMPITPPQVPPPPPIRDLQQPAPASLADPAVAPLTVPDGIAPEVPRVDPGFENTVAPEGTVLGEFPVTAIVPMENEPVVKKPVVIGGLVRRPMKTRDVQPVYPPLAQAARVQGIVIIEATLSEDGRVMNARVLRSVPLLDNAALDAVRQWEFTPTFLNGVAVPVVMTVTVQFVLSK